MIRHTSPYTVYSPTFTIDVPPCETGPVCGDNVVEGSEACDEGGIDTASCDGDCTLPFCPDLRANAAAGEQCDDGNVFDGDGCDTSCQVESFCGDGVVGPGEECDNGGGTYDNPGTTESADCDADCSAAECGDGTTNVAAGEECDDANSNNSDSCDNDCFVNPAVIDADVNFAALDLDAQTLVLYGRNICAEPTVEIGQSSPPGIPLDISSGITAATAQQVDIDLSGFGLVFDGLETFKAYVQCPGGVVLEIDISIGPAGPPGEQGEQGPPGLPGELPDSTSATGGSQPFDNRQPFLGVSYIIALEGILPTGAKASEKGVGGAPFIGEIRIFAGNYTPAGWAFCDGTLLPITEYTQLFSILSTTYGGDGQSTFALPDLGGRVPVHIGQGPGLSNVLGGETGGTEAVTKTTSQMPSHSHDIPD